MDTGVLIPSLKDLISSTADTPRGMVEVFLRDVAYKPHWFFTVKETIVDRPHSDHDLEVTITAVDQETIHGRRTITRKFHLICDSKRQPRLNERRLHIDLMRHIHEIEQEIATHSYIYRGQPFNDATAPQRDGLWGYGDYFEYGVDPSIDERISGMQALAASMKNEKAASQYAQHYQSQFEQQMRAHQLEKAYHNKFSARRK
jgi:hypothetical protein